MNIDYVRRLIVELGFTPQDGTSGIFVKRYATTNNEYPIFVDFNEQKIDYDPQRIQSDKHIRLGDLTTSNFDKPENFVVLECIDRLLSKGYHPECLELEKKYPLGHNLKGKLDILVYSEDEETPFLMIECKTWGSEFEKESARTIKDGGQIFSYYQQDRAAKFLCLYASHLDNKKIEYRNHIVLVQESWHDLSSAKDIHDYWNKNFKDNGIFEAYSTPYNIKPKVLTYEMLKTLKEEDSGKIYNQIMEILRHNAISDKPNAFNKLLNLFVCKIIDENKNPTDELEFQWLETDTDESLQMRLNDLYKDGMLRFLDIKIIDHTEEDVAKALEGIDNSTQKQQLMDMFRDARLKKSPNFAFLEVLDEKTFKLNAKIVREIVELLQVYKFRYQQKHEFLGNFFELLLNTSMKQEAGQFFTPVPITRFIISSLPLKEFVQNKIDCRERDVLPKVIDYACGSGHFLTEYMDKMQTIIESKIDISAALPNIKNMIKSWQGLTKFLWAKDSVYGIDLDNRLVKTTKVSAFFNGDGEANIIWANGLDNFEKSEEYRGLLRQTQPYDRKNNGQFDILISNPPYSVEAFKSTLRYGEESFELYNNITDNSSEIECLFVERMKQLLKVGGWAGIILPSSILSNSGIYSKAREILFKYFKVKAIVELGSGTFMKTGTNTIILFLERRSDNDFVTIGKAINTFVSNLKDVTVLGIENAFYKYVSNAYDNLTFDDYISFISGKASIAMQKHELYSDYQKAFSDDMYAKAITLEKEKMLYFLLTYTQNIVLVKTGKKQEEKNFLGYEFSERRGHEGIKHLPGGTKMFDEDGDLMNPRKANSYIYNAFLGKTVNIDESLARNVSYGRMSGFINYGTSKFDKVVNLNRRQMLTLESQYPLVTLGNIANISRGASPRPIDSYLTTDESGVNWIKIGDVSESDKYISNTKEKITQDGAKKSKAVVPGDIIISNSMSTGRPYVLKISGCIHDGWLLLSNISDVINREYLYYALTFNMVQRQFKAESLGGVVNNLNTLRVSGVKIPLPPLDVQQKIVAEIKNVESQETHIREQIGALRLSISTAIKDSFATTHTTEKLGVLAQYSQDRILCNKLSADTYVGVDNILQNMGGKVASQFVPSVGTAIAYSSGDILLSNIRPYLKKIWLANNDGGSSGDVLVLKVNKKVIFSEYLYYLLARDEFFEYEMQHVKGVKMPRAEKSSVLNYTVPVPSLIKQQEVVAEIEKIEAKIKAVQVKLAELKIAKDNVLKKYL